MDGPNGRQTSGPTSPPSPSPSPPLRMDALKLAVTSNLSLCCFHQTEYAQSVFYACKAMEHDPGSVKLLLRRARALSMKVCERASRVHILLHA